MCKDPDSEGRMIAIHQILAFLLARESLASKSSIVDIGNKLKGNIVSGIKNSSSKLIESEINITNEEISTLSKSASSEIESIFAMAEVFYTSLLEKEK